jgi:hypothetical protein
MTLGQPLQDMAFVSYFQGDVNHPIFVVQQIPVKYMKHTRNCGTSLFVTSWIVNGPALGSSELVDEESTP